ncbi:MAG: hypothetical protein H0Z28_12760 [Archaeoglobus sp.]|nr:hypothetical protein [Archaeoglobus sp.]
MIARDSGGYFDNLARKLAFRLKITDKDFTEHMDLGDLLIQNLLTMEEPKTKQECNNQFVWIKRLAPVLEEKYHEAKKRSHEYELKLNKVLNESKKQYIEDFDEYERNCYELVEASRKIVMILKGIIIWTDNRLKNICKYYDEIDLPLSEFASLVGINLKTAEKNVAKISKWIRDEDSKHYSYIFHGIEDEGIEKYFKWNRNGMPLFWLTTKTLALYMDENPNLKELTISFLADTGVPMYIATEFDEEGRPIKLDQYCPPLREVKNVCKKRNSPLPYR